MSAANNLTAGSSYAHKIIRVYSNSYNGRETTSLLIRMAIKNHPNKYTINVYVVIDKPAHEIGVEPGDGLKINSIDSISFYWKNDAVYASMKSTSIEIIKQADQPYDDDLRHKVIEEAHEGDYYVPSETNLPFDLDAIKRED